jgi:hypothetical protein
LVDDALDAVSREHFQRRLEGRLRQGVGVLPDEKRAADALVAPVFADGRGDRQDVRLVEGATLRRASMTARTEANAL